MKVQFDDHILECLPGSYEVLVGRMMERLGRTRRQVAGALTASLKRLSNANKVRCDQQGTWSKVTNEPTPRA